MSALVYKRPAEALPPVGAVVLCWGHPHPFEDDCVHYLAAINAEGDWICDATGKRVIAPYQWAKPEAPR